MNQMENSNATVGATTFEWFFSPQLSPLTEIGHTIFEFSRKCGTALEESLWLEVKFQTTVRDWLRSCRGHCMGKVRVGLSFENHCLLLSLKLPGFSQAFTDLEPDPLPGTHGWEFEVITSAEGSEVRFKKLSAHLCFKKWVREKRTWLAAKLRELTGNKSPLVELDFQNPFGQLLTILDETVV